MLSLLVQLRPEEAPVAGCVVLCIMQVHWFLSTAGWPQGAQGVWASLARDLRDMHQVEGLPSMHFAETTVT